MGSQRLLSRAPIRYYALPVPQRKSGSPPMRFRTPALLIASLLSLTACYKQEIRQGNFLSDDKIALVKTGMTQAQVQFVLGPPMVRDPFHPSRWDYVRYVNP